MPIAVTGVGAGCFRLRAFWTPAFGPQRFQLGRLVDWDDPGDRPAVVGHRQDPTRPYLSEMAAQSVV